MVYLIYRKWRRWRRRKAVWDGLCSRMRFKDIKQREAPHNSRDAMYVCLLTITTYYRYPDNPFTVTFVKPLDMYVHTRIELNNAVSEWFLYVALFLSMSRWRVGFVDHRLHLFHPLTTAPYANSNHTSSFLPYSHHLDRETDWMIFHRLESIRQLLYSVR